MVAITQIPKELSTVGVTFGVMNRLDWKVNDLPKLREINEEFDLEDDKSILAGKTVGSSRWNNTALRILGLTIEESQKLGIPDGSLIRLAH